MKTKIIKGTTKIIHLIEIPIKMKYIWKENKDFPDENKWELKEIVKNIKKGKLISQTDIQFDWDNTSETELVDSFEGYITGCDYCAELKATGNKNEN